MSHSRWIVLLIGLGAAAACEDTSSEAPAPTETVDEVDVPEPEPEPEALAPMNAAEPCPSGRVEDEARASRIRERLASTETGARVLAELGQRQYRLCFGPTNFRLVMGWRLMLPAAVSDDELAPEVGRMLDELVYGSAIPASIDEDADCDALVEAALSRQATMFVEEARMRVAFELPPERYGFEAAFRAASPEEQQQIVLSYISRPEGEDGDPPAMRARFEAHCQRARARE